MGNIKVQAGHLQKLIDALLDKTNEENSPTGLRTIAEQIRGITSDYIYKKIYLPVSKQKENSTITLRESPLNLVAKFLGYRSFKDFVLNLTKPKNIQLKSLVGDYFNFVRKNLKIGELFQAPVRIRETESGFLFELKGASSLYVGEPIIVNGCLFITMKSVEGKLFHHIYKIGNQKKPGLMQGTFTGVSTTFEPIGGRTLMIKTTNSFETKENQSVKVQDLLRSKNEDHQRIGAYFKEYANNNVTPHKSYTFDYDDLEPQV